MIASLGSIIHFWHGNTSIKFRVILTALYSELPCSVALRYDTTCVRLCVLLLVEYFMLTSCTQIFPWWLRILSVDLRKEFLEFLLNQLLINTNKWLTLQYLTHVAESKAKSIFTASHQSHCSPSVSCEITESVSVRRAAAIQWNFELSVSASTAPPLVR